MMRRMQEDMDRIFGQFFGGQGDWGEVSPFAAQSGMQRWSPQMDISQTDREWTIEVDLPGVKEEEIDVRIDDRHLMIRAEMRQEEETPQGEGTEAQGRQPQGLQAQQRQYARRERRYGFFERVLRLPENVDEESIRLEFQSGVLTLHLPKTEQVRERGRRIPIQSGASQGQASAGQPRSSQAQAGAQQAQTAPTNGNRAAGQSNATEPAITGSKGGEAGGDPQRRKRQP
jgi:HSP20 family protein